MKCTSDKNPCQRTCMHIHKWGWPSRSIISIKEKNSILILVKLIISFSVLLEKNVPNIPRELISKQTNHPLCFHFRLYPKLIHAQTNLRNIDHLPWLFCFKLISSPRRSTGDSLSTKFKPTGVVCSTNVDLVPTIIDGLWALKQGDYSLQFAIDLKQT